MVAEVLAAIDPRAGGRYVDGTVGGGGHAAAILEASAPTGSLFGCDRDGAALEAAAARLAEFAGRFELRRGNFEELAAWVEAASCDGVVLDLGVSSLQLDRAERGFSFQQDGPLDMRMDRRQALRAADLVNDAGAHELTEIFRDLGEEPKARRLARAIESERRFRRFETTRQLAELIERISPRPFRRVRTGRCPILSGTSAASIAIASGSSPSIPMDPRDSSPTPYPLRIAQSEDWRSSRSTRSRTASRRNSAANIRAVTSSRAEWTCRTCGERWRRS